MRRSVLCIAAFAAIALTIWLAPASASATVLCSKQVTPCGAGNTYGATTSIKAALPTMTTTVIENEFANVTCLENKTAMKVTAAGGKGVSAVVKVSEMTFGQCTVPNGMGGTENCTVKAINLGAAEAEQYSGFFEQGKNGNGMFGITGSGLGTFGFSVLCNEKVEKINCTLRSGTNSTVTGGPVGAIKVATIVGAEKMKPVAGGKKCPVAEPIWRFTWAVSEPANFFLEAE